MEPNDPHPHLHHHNFSSLFFTNPTVSVSSAQNNGLSPLSTTPTHQPQQQQQQQQNTVYPSHAVGPSSAAVTSAVPVERRKRGRPRKYGTAEQALAARKDYSTTTNHHKDNQFNKRGDLSGTSPGPSSSPKSSNLLALRDVGHGFTPHVVNVASGEDVCQKLMLFLRQSKREMCILSASGSISNVSLLQPAMSGGCISYEGQFEIISLSGSYVRTDIGEKAGGLSICLLSLDGQIIGGGIGGPLKAAGPVQVIVGTFLLGHKKYAVAGGLKGDISSSKLLSPVGGPTATSVGFHPPVDSFVRNPIHGNDEHQIVGGNPHMIQHHVMLVTPPRPTDWRDSPDARTIGVTYDFSGRTGHGAHQSPENGDYEHFPD